MRKTLFGFGLAVLASLTVAMTYPPAQDLVLGQQRCGNNLCMGSPATQVNVKGNMLVDLPILPTSANGILIDGGVGIQGALSVNGATTLKAAVTLSGTTTVSVVDAGMLCAQGGCTTRILPFTTGAFDFASVTTTCNETGAIAVTGAQTGDSCIVGPPSTGGSANAAYTCYVSSAGNIKVRHCAVGTADDPVSATFNGFVISSQ